MRIANGIYSLGQEEGGRVHAFLLDDGNGLTLIDTMYDDDARHVLAELTSIGKTPADVKHIILTLADCDRCRVGHGEPIRQGAAAAIKKLAA